MPRRKQKSDGRTKKRVPISRAVRIRCQNWDHFVTEYASNISEGGIFIKTRQPLSLGTLFNLELSVGGENVLAKAQVIWTKEFSEGETRPSGMGARFIEISPESQVILSRWINQAS